MRCINVKEAVQEFCKAISGGTAIAVPHEPAPWARPGYCFANVKRKVGESGGKGQFGWQFMQIPVGGTPGVIVAVHHEVWASPDEELVDITPCPELAVRSDGGVLFLPDDGATLPRPIGFEVGVSRPSKFYPLARTAKVRRMVEAARLQERQYWEQVMGSLT